MGGEIAERGGVAYRALRARSLLNRCTAPRMPFSYTVNPFRGCAMGCRYCYATYTHEFMGIDRAEEFHSTVFVKEGADEETARVLRRLVARGERIALGTATDPYQPGEARAGVTRRFLELVAQHRGARLSLTTKGALVLRDLPLLAKIRERSELSVNISLISLRADLLRRIEPWAPPPEVRLTVMQRLVDAGIDVCLGLAPILPLLTDADEDLEAVVAAAAGAGVRRVWANVLFLRSPTRQKYLAWLRAEFPQHVEAYEHAYGGDTVYLRGSYRRHVDTVVARLSARHGFVARESFAERGARPQPRQLGLFADGPG